MRIYIAGPYTPRKGTTLHDASRIAQKNTDYAIEIAISLIKKGHYPFVPHLSHYIHLKASEDFGEYYYKLDNTFLKYWAEALFYTAKSPGADKELGLAKELGLKIFYSIDEIPDEEI